MDGLSWALLGAALATGLACIGSAIGVSTAGKAATGVVSEKPNLFGKILVLQALPGSQGIYGFIITILVLVKLGMLGGGGAPDLTEVEGMKYFAACMPIALAGLGSAIYQGKVSASAIMMTGKNPSLSGNGIIMTALVETYAILALLTSIIMYVAI